MLAWDTLQKFKSLKNPLLMVTHTNIDIREWTTPDKSKAVSRCVATLKPSWLIKMSQLKDLL